MSIEIIGAGFPRTGTTTLKQSLELLGYGKCYHMKELLVNPDMLHYWLSLENSGDTDWNGLYRGYRATVDFPAYPFYKEHLKRYPDAKVILTVRDFDSWYESAQKTIWQAGNQPKIKKAFFLLKNIFKPRAIKAAKCVGFMRRVFWGREIQGKFLDKEATRKIFYQHIEDVKKYVPESQLLVYDVKEGWEPLCQFLGVEVPVDELPHLNKKEDFPVMLQKLRSGEMV